MKKLLLITLSFCSFNALFAQDNNPQAPDTTYNFGFEKISTGKTMPDKWARFSRSRGYIFQSVTDEKHGGERSLLIENNGSDTSDKYGSVRNIVPAKYAGKEIEFKVYLKLQDVKQSADLMIRIDNAEQMAELKSLKSEVLTGTKDWAQYSVKASMPVGAQTIYLAVLLNGQGKLWIDDAQVLIDGRDISQAPLNPDYREHPYGHNPAASGIVKLKTATLYYEIYGNGEPLLLLHGDSQSIYAFNFQIGDLAKKYKVIAVDTRGQGKSTDETSGPLTYDLFADDMKQLLDSLHITKANILGWSDGGNTGLTMAVKYPQYINKLAVMGANLFATSDAVADTILQQTKAARETFGRRPDAHSKMETRLFTMMLTEPHLSFGDMKRIKSPVLIMAGEHDVILENHTRAIAGAIPNSKLVIFTGASHYAPVEIPKKFNDTVLAFFSE